MLKRFLATTLALGLFAGAAAAQAPVVNPLRRPAQASPAEPTAPPEEAAKTKRQLTPGMQAARLRQKQCGTEWKAEKAAGKVAAGTKWPQYWSACNKRLKGGTA